MSLLPLGLLSQGGGAGAAGSFELISTQVLGSSTSSVTFSSIPSTYKHLQLRIAARATSTGNATALFVRCNGVSGTSYSTHNLYAAGGGSGAVYAEGYTGLDAFYRLPIPDDALTANAFGVVFIDFLDYASTVKNKTLRATSGYAASGVYNTNLVSGAFNSTNAITSLSFTPAAGQLKTGSRFSLYGIQGV
jgi:hypothetical protein